MEEKYESLKLKNQLCFPIYLCAKEVTRRYTPLLNELELTYTQYVVMMYFWEMKESNLKDISNALLIDSGTLTPLLKRLEKKGYIERNRSVVDERNLVIKLTKKGDELKEKALHIPNEMKKCIGLSEDEANTLYKLVYKVLENVERK